MDPRWSRKRLVAALSVTLSICGRCVEAGATVQALSVPPSATWYGDDGTWSAISIRVGNPQQWVDVMVSTVSSETWVAGPGACASDDSTCSFMRGGIADASKSSTWQNLGFYELGADKQLGNTGYAQYGLDGLTFGGTNVVIPSAIIGAFNGTGPISGTSYLLGLFGLGVVPGSFNNTSPLSALSALVEQVGAVPSHSWGYTAGAKYQQKGVVNSLTLGGYDANRFIPHNVTFNLDAGKQLLTFVDSISVSSSAASNAWTEPVQLLVAADRVSAFIDSSTPYLWFPEAVCERFAQSLGLTYNSSLNLYTFDANLTQHASLAASSLSFTFTLSDLTLGPATVNITLPYAAFDLQLTYPAIPSTNYGDADSSKYYFPLRQANSEGQYTIGRAFLQEAYVITDYERNTFSVHQAIHPTDSVGNTSIVSISPPPNTSFSGNPSTSGSTLSAGAIAGVAIGAVLLFAIAALLISYRCRRKRQTNPSDAESEKPLSTQSPPRTLLSRLLNRHQPCPSRVHEASGCCSYPTEVSADASHERFELPAPLGPVELEGESSSADSLDATTEDGSSTLDSANLTAYERARRKLERQQAAAFPLSPPREAYPVEKSDADVSQVAHYRAPESPSIDPDSAHVSPIVDSPSHARYPLAISGQASPVSPDLTTLPPLPLGPPPTYHRLTPTPSNVVYVGRLPDNVQLPHVVPRLVGPNGRSLASQSPEHESEDLYGSGSGSGGNVVSPISGAGSHPLSSLGSSDGTGTQPRGEEGGTTGLGRNPSLLDPWGSRRRLDGEDLVHVPQPAAHRYSWEEERISGTEEERRL